MVTMSARVGLAMLVLVACGGGGDDDGGGGSDLITTPRCVDSIDVAWSHEYSIGVTTLRANTISIDSNGVLHTPPTELGMVQLDSDPPSGTLPDSTTLAMLWYEGAVIVKLNIYFETDGTDWWASQLKHKDDQIIAGDDWVEYNRELFRCPVGQAYVSDETLEPDAAPASITFEDLFVRAF
jgi:hypothetical protein